MEAEFWQDRWDTQNIGFNQAQTNGLLTTYFKNFDSKPGDHVLVPLCGKSVDMLWLLEQGLTVTGVELSAEACRAFFDENKLQYEESQQECFTVFSGDNITLYAGDFFKFQNTKAIDLIYDRAALIALPDEMRTQYANHLTTLSNTNTQMLLITASYDQSKMPGPPFSISDQMVEALYTHNWDINTLHSKANNNIPPHLQAKGLDLTNDYVFQLSKKD